MIINNHYNFYFYHIMKCGGTSIRTMLKDIDSSKEVVYYKHSMMKYVETVILHHPITNFKNSFAIVRNPWERLYSLYCDIHSRFGTMTGGEELDKFYSKHYNDVKNKSFSDWVINAHYINPNDRSRMESETRISQCECMRSSDGMINIKAIFKMEEYDKILDYVNSLTNSKYKFTEILHLNKSLSLNNKQYSDEYTQKAKIFVDKYFEEDIDRFGYTFD